MGNTSEISFEYSGHKIRFYLPNPDDHIQKLIFQSETFYELEMLESIRQLMSPGGLAVDVGANIGNHSVYLSAVLGMKVLALEPLSQCFQILCRNLSLNGVEGQVEAMNIAAGRGPARGRISGVDPHNFGMTRIELDAQGDVEVVSLDDLAREPVRLLKIDVEGMALQVLEGAERIITDDQPVLYVEANDIKEHDELRRFLTRFGYLEIEEFNWTPTLLFLPSSNEAQRFTVLTALHRSAERRLAAYAESFRKEKEKDSQEWTLTLAKELRGKLDKLEKRILDNEKTLTGVFGERNTAIEGQLFELKESFGEFSEVQDRFSIELLEELRGMVQGLDSFAGKSEIAIEKLESRQSSALKQALDLLEENLSLGRRSAAVSDQLFSLSEAVDSVKTGQSDSGQEIRALEKRLQAQSELIEALSERTRKLEGLLDRNLGAVQEKQNAKLEYLELQSRWLEERVQKETGKILEAIGKYSRPEVDPNRQKVIEQQKRIDALRESNQAIRSSTSFMLGRAFADIRYRPLSGLVKLPGRLLKIASNQVREIRSDPGWTPVNPGPGLERKGGLSTETWIEDVIEMSPDREQVFSDSFSDSWNGWKANQQVSLLRNGLVRIEQEKSTPGLRKKGVRVDGGSVYRLTFNGSIASKRGKAYWSIIDSDSQVLLNPVLYFSGAVLGKSGQGSVLFRTLNETRSIDLHLVIENPSLDDSIEFERVVFEKIPDSVAYPRDQDVEVTASLSSIPERRHMLKNSIASLLPAVDRLFVYLNNFGEIPDYLVNERIEVVRSEDYGDNGDAGKFFWSGTMSSSGYRFVCDDDIIYPVDYIPRLINKLRKYENGVVVGVHGVLLKQPISSYHGMEDRHVLSFRYGLETDRFVHLLGTGTVAYFSDSIDIRREDFQFKNMADVWFARVAQSQKVPMLSLRRPRNWLVAQKDSLIENIYVHSWKQKGTVMDTSKVQNHVIAKHQPWTIQLPGVRRSGQPLKVVFAVITFNRKDYLRECIESWLETRNPAYEWVVIVADDGSDDGTLEYLEELKIPHELHVLRNRRRYAAGQTNSILQLCDRLGFDYGFKSDDDVIFMKRGWDDLYIQAMQKSGFDHLCYLHKEHFAELRRKSNPSFELPKAVNDESGTCAAVTGAVSCMGAFFTFTEKVIREVGFADVESFPIRGQWHIDYSLRCCRAGLNEEETFFDANDSNEYLELQNMVSEGYRCSLEWGDEYKATREPSELERRTKILEDRSRLYLNIATASEERGVGCRINDFFDRVYVLNLERRPDRWERVQRQCRHYDLEVEQFPAVNGSMEPVLSEFKEYSSRPIVLPSAGVRSVENSYQYYLDHDSQRQRIAYLERKLGRKAIQTPGAWGYLKSMIDLIQEAIDKGWESILVLDDDVIFHKKINLLFERFIREVPDNWKILQLGTLQYHWEPEWIDWHSDHVYRCRGSSVGSHAVGVHHSVFAGLLSAAMRFDLPFDDGALNCVKRAYPDECFTFYPNLMIQDTSESDIASSEVQASEGQQATNKYRWELSDYGPP